MHELSLKHRARAPPEVFHTIPLLSKPLKLDSVFVYLLGPDVEFKSIIITCVCKKIRLSVELTALPHEMRLLESWDLRCVSCKPRGGRYNPIL